MSADSGIVVISDEAHRSKYGLGAKMDREGRFSYCYARHLRDALENATFIGFTGTPVSAQDHDTRAVFGEYVSIYDIQDAVDDGATMPIYYESRLAKLDVRVFKDKPGGLVVDYIGIANELKAALKVYIESDGRGKPANLAEEALPKLFENLDIARGILHGFDYSAFATDGLNLLVPAVNHLLRQDEASSGDARKRAFLDAVAAINAALALCGTLDAAEPVKQEAAFLSAVKAAVMKCTDVDRRRSEAEKHSALRRILDNALISEGVEDVFNLAGLDRPNISLLDDRFLEDVRNMKSRNLAVELLEKLLKGEIGTRLRRNLVQEKKYSERLLESIRKYRNRAIETAQVIEELIQMAKDMQAAAKRDEDLDLNADEVAFYDALADNESAVRELGDDILKKIATEITEKLRNSTVVDWQKRESVRAKLRILVRRTLQKWKYPPDKQDAAVELVLKQAEGIAEIWAPAA